MNAALRLALSAALLSGCSSGGPVPHGAQLVRTAGDGQIGLAGQPLPLGPSVQVSDGKGNPVAGVPVGCQVLTGGGAAGVEVSQSDENGIATCGAWTLGHKTGLNQLQVYANGLDPVVFSAAALDTSSTFGLAIQEPSTAFTGTALTVVVTTQDENRISTVAASYGGKTLSLSLLSQTDTTSVFSGTLQLEDLSTGSIDALVVRATDDHFGLAETAALLTFDQPPQLLVTSPPPQLSFSRPELQLSVTNVGDQDVGLTVRSHGRVLAQGTNILLKTIDLSAFDNQVDEIELTATDALGVTTTVNRQVWVSSNPKLVPRLSVEGTMIDFDGTRGLHRGADGVVIDDLSQGISVRVAPDQGLPGALGPQGAVLCASGVFSGGSLFIDGEAAFIPVSCNTFDVEGTHLLITDPFDTAWFCDLDQNVLIPASGFKVAGAVSLATTGDAVFNDELNRVIHLTPDGMASPLPLDARVRPNPVTDGRLTAYSVCDGNDCPSVGVWDGIQESLITPDAPPASVWVNNGFVGWTSFAGPEATAELWEERWPGTAVQLAPQLQLPTVLGLLSDGTFLAIGGDRLWRVPLVGVPEPLGTLPPNDTLRLVQRNGRAFLLIEGLAIEVLP